MVNKTGSPQDIYNFTICRRICNFTISKWRRKCWRGTLEHKLNEANTFAGPSPAFFKLCKLTLYCQYAHVCGCLRVCVRACIHACMFVWVHACICVYELRTVSTDMILCFTNTLIIIILRRKEVKLPGFTSPVADILCCSQVQACVHSQCLLFFHTNHLESVKKSNNNYQKSHQILIKNSVKKSNNTTYQKSDIRFWNTS